MTDRDNTIETIRMHLPAIAEMTQRNEHTQALLRLTTVTGLNRENAILRHIQSIADVEFEMPHSLGVYRREIERRVRDHIFIKYPELVAEVTRSL